MKGSAQIRRKVIQENTKIGRWEEWKTWGFPSNLCVKRSAYSSLICVIKAETEVSRKKAGAQCAPYKRLYLNQFAVENQMLIIDRYLEGGAERVGVGTAGGVFAVDGFNGDAVDWLKFSLEKVMQDAEVLLH